MLIRQGAVSGRNAGGGASTEPRQIMRRLGKTGGAREHVVETETYAPLGSPCAASSLSREGRRRRLKSELAFTAIWKSGSGIERVST